MCISIFSVHFPLLQVHTGVKGIVTDLNGSPVLGAKVQVAGPSIGHDISSGNYDFNTRM